MTTQQEAVRMVRDEDLQQLVKLYRHLHEDDIASTCETIDAAWQAIKAMPGMSIVQGL